MQNKPVLLDLFCRKGGATRGYQQAGFYVVGMDIEPQPGYPGDAFIQGDAIDALKALLNLGRTGWGVPALIHTSPPCQDGNTATASNRARGLLDNHQQLVPPTRDLLNKIGLPYVIEQPTSSRKDLIRRDVTLCMDMFKGELPPPWVQKHRSFELGFWNSIPMADEHVPHAGYVRGWRGKCNGKPGFFRDGPYVAGYGKGGGKGTLTELRHAMQIDWMTEVFDLCEAIPPAYTRWMGSQFLAVHPR